jgi:hypothetical protein
MGQRVIAYARALNGEHEELASAMQQFAKINNLDIKEEFIDQGHTSEAWAAAFRRLTLPGAECSLLIPALSSLGENRREVRGRMAGLRSAGVSIYEVEGGMHITWTVAQIKVPISHLTAPLRERNA